MMNPIPLKCIISFLFPINRFTHPCVKNPADLTRYYEHLITLFIQDFDIPDITKSPIMSRFFAGILVKNVIQYYVNQLCQPEWINGCIVSLACSNNRGNKLLSDCSLSASSTPSESTTPCCQSAQEKTIISGNQSFIPNSTEPTTSSRLTSIFDSNVSTKNKEDEGQLNVSPKPQLFRDAISTTTGTNVEPKSALIYADASEIDGSSVATGKGTYTNVFHTFHKQGSVSAALGNVLPSSTLPLLPFGSFSGNSGIGGSVSSPPSPHVKSDLNAPSMHSVGIESSDETGKKESSGCEEDEKESENDPRVPTHYYSFDEASKGRKVPPALETSTKSVDQLYGRKTLSGKQDLLELNAHETGMGEGNKKDTNRSPIYEEPEDFAASIAKLRSLLEQRESQKKLELTEPTDTGEVGKKGDKLGQTENMVPTVGHSNSNICMESESNGLKLPESSWNGDVKLGSNKNAMFEVPDSDGRKLADDSEKLDGDK